MEKVLETYSKIVKKYVQFFFFRPISMKIFLVSKFQTISRRKNFARKKYF